MEVLYHQTNQIIQETSALFQKLENDPSNHEAVESSIQSKINAINANCDKLDILLYKTPINQRTMAKMRVDQLKYDNKHIQNEKILKTKKHSDHCKSDTGKIEIEKKIDECKQKIKSSDGTETVPKIYKKASLSNAQTKRLRREQEKADREQLLTRRFGNDHTAINVDYLGQEQTSLHNSHRNVDEMIHTGTSMLETLRYNRETLKGAHRRIIDLANTLGLSNATISLIERRVSQDKYILFGGMFVTVAVVVLVIIYLT